MKNSVTKWSKIGLYTICASAGLGLAVVSSNEKLRRKGAQQERQQDSLFKDYRDQQQKSFARGITTKLTTTTAPKDLLIVANNIKQECQKTMSIDTHPDYTLWADNCVFADSSTSSGGSPGSTARFKALNDSALPYLENPVYTITSMELEKLVTDDIHAGTTEETVKMGESWWSPTITTKTYYVVRLGYDFKCHLKLPWHPVLAVTGIAVYYVDTRSQKIVRYEDKNTSDLWVVFKRLFVPT